MEDNFQEIVSQETAKKATISPIFQPELAEIRAKLTEWDQDGSGKVALWIFDAAFHQLYESEGFEFANKLLTQTRHALKRAEHSKPLSWPPPCKGDRQPDAWRKNPEKTTLTETEQGADRQQKAEKRRARGAAL